MSFKFLLYVKKNMSIEDFKSEFIKGRQLISNLNKIASNLLW